MSITVADVAAEIEAVAPRELAEDWDNVGLQVGEPAAAVTGVLVCLEMTDAVVDEACEAGANLIVAHHPLIFGSLDAVRTDRPVGRLIGKMLRAEIAAFVAHTNLDAAPEIGTAAVLADLLGVEFERPLLSEGEVGLGCVGNIADAIPLAELIERINERLRPARIVAVGPEEARIQRLALMPGSGGDAVGAAVAAGADALICGDLKHHDALDALAMGLTVIDATHYATERPVVERLGEHLAAALQDGVAVTVSNIVTDPFADALQ